MSGEVKIDRDAKTAPCEEGEGIGLDRALGEDPSIEGARRSGVN